MDFSLSAEPITSDTLVIADFEGSHFAAKDKHLTSQIQTVLKLGDFQGKDAQIQIIHTFAVPARLILLGLGTKDAFHLNKLRVAVALAVNQARQLGIEEMVFAKNNFVAEPDFITSVIEGSILACHKFNQYKSDKPKVKLNRIKVCGSNKAALESAVIITRYATQARDLINTPASIAHPPYLAAKAAVLCKDVKNVKCTIIDKKELQKLGAQGILAVAAGSIHEPRMVVLEYSPAAAKKKIALVGKGITFDSGGLDIKPAQGMETMKDDMSGSAAVLCTVLAAARLNLAIKVVGIMALAENMPGPLAYKPGDIIVTMSGKSIEILNTDAEGRVALADALHYVKQFKPDKVIDIATLTGACVVALGGEAAGLVSNDAQLVAKLKAAGEKTFERVWELPFYPEYQEYIKSDCADVKNVVSNSGSGGGAVTAARFLANFIEGFNWAHLDIAGVAWSDSDVGYKPKGATGVGVRLLTEYLRSEC